MRLHLCDILEKAIDSTGPRSKVRVSEGELIPSSPGRILMAGLRGTHGAAVVVVDKLCLC